jgi:hypothetical protein
MLSIASLMPVGGYQAQKATIEDRKSVIGQNAFHEFRTRGMANAENWVGIQHVPGQTFPKPLSVAIDPLMFTSPTIGGNASKQFPRQSQATSTAPAMLRVGLRFSTGATANAAHQVAQQIFMSHDETVFEEDPSNPDAPAVSKWEVDNNNQPVRRQFAGDFSWMATLAPAYFDPTPKAPWVWPAEYQLSLVIFYKRNLVALANEQGVAYERQVPVKQQTAADLAGFGLGGGELLLVGGPDETNVQAGNWVMVCGRYGDATQGPPVFRWYRVATVGAFENDQGARPVTLAGPDWIGVTDPLDPTHWRCKPSHVAIFEGCVGVFEKTVHLEGPSVWSP